MPAPPEFCDGLGHIGIAEVLWVFEAKDAAHANGHVGITGEIKIDLEHVHQHAEPEAERGGGREAPAEQLIGHGPGIVRDQNLFGQADAEARHAVEAALRRALARLNLLLHIGIADDRPGDELWKERHVEQEFRKRPLHTDLSAIDVNHIAHGLERVERDANGQGDLRRGALDVRQRIDVFQQKARVLEHAEAEQIEDHRERQKLSLRLLAEQTAKGPVRTRDSDHQQQVDRLAPRIEQQTCDEQYAVLCL